MLLTIAILNDDFFLPSRRGGHVKSDSRLSFKYNHPSSYLVGKCALWSATGWALFTLQQTASCNGLPPTHPAINRHCAGGRSESTQKPSNTAVLFTYICTRALHSFLSFARCRTASAVIPPLQADFTPWIQPTIGGLLCPLLSTHLHHRHPFYQYDTRPFSPCVQIISIFSDPLIHAWTDCCSNVNSH